MQYTATISWQKHPDETFADLRYSRAHRWAFDGGTTVAASSSPHVVPLPMSDASAVDPEEALVAAVSSCHMLFFLSIAAAKKFVVSSYEDHAEGTMAKNEAGKIAMTEIILRPKLVFEGTHIPTPAQIEAMHHRAHEECFIANSLKTTINIISR